MEQALKAILDELSDRSLLNGVDDDLHIEIAEALVKAVLAVPTAIEASPVVGEIEAVAYKLVRKPEQYAACSPKAVAGGSVAQMMYFVEDAKKDIAALLAQVQSLTLKLAERDKALEPFANADELSGSEDLPDSTCLYSACSITLGDLRRARALQSGGAEQ